MPIVKHLQDTQLKQLPEFRPGHTVRVHQKVIDIITDPKSGKVTHKERVQIFEPIVKQALGEGVKSYVHDG